MPPETPAPAKSGLPRIRRHRLPLALLVLAWVAGSLALLLVKRALPIQLRAAIVFGVLLAGIFLLGLARRRIAARKAGD